MALLQLRLNRKWLVLGLGCLLIPLYQNMGPVTAPLSEGQTVDIRDYAPRKPSGYWDNPMAAYVPGHFSGGSLNDVGESLLGHNMDPMMKRTEFLGFSLLDGSDSFSGTENSLGDYSFEKSPSSSLRFDVVSPSQVRLSYNLVSSTGGGGWSMVCQADARSGVSLQMNHPLSSQIHLGVSHETEARLSQFRMGIAW